MVREEDIYLWLRRYQSQEYKSGVSTGALPVAFFHHLTPQRLINGKRQTQGEIQYSRLRQGYFLVRGTGIADHATTITREREFVDQGIGAVACAIIHLFHLLESWTHKTTWHEY